MRLNPWTYRVTPTDVLGRPLVVNVLTVLSSDRTRRFLPFSSKGPGVAVDDTRKRGRRDVFIRGHSDPQAPVGPRPLKPRPRRTLLRLSESSRAMSSDCAKKETSSSAAESCAETPGSTPYGDRLSGPSPSVDPMRKPTHVHSFTVGDSTAAPLVLLHGSDGTDADLLPLANELAPGATNLAIRGAVATCRGFAYFQRLPDRQIDQADIARRTPVLANFIQTSCAAHGLTRRPVAISFSNGAIMAAALLMTHPDLLAGAILFRPLSPFASDVPDRLDGTPVLIIAGEHDTRRSPGDGQRLAQQLRHSGALVTHHLLPVGHPLTTQDEEIAREWLRPLRT